MSTLAIVYHADADGAASAALVYHLYAEIIPKETKTPVPDIIFIRQGSKNYGKVAPLEDIPEGADVIVVDYSYDEEELLKLKARAGSFQLYDHHKSAEEKLAHIEGCVFDCSVGGVEVVWNELYLKKISELNLGLLKSDHYRKCVVKIVGECDIYRFDYPECQIFIAGIAALGDITSPSWMSEVFNKWESIESEVYREGQIALKRDLREAKAIAREAVVVQYKGYSIGLINYCGGLRSKVGQLTIEGRFCDIAMMYGVSSDGVEFHLRGSDSGKSAKAFAEEFGGGGHRNACGYTLDLPKGLELIKYLYGKKVE